MAFLRKEQMLGMDRKKRWCELLDQNLKIKLNNNRCEERTAWAQLISCMLQLGKYTQTHMHTHNSHIYYNQNTSPYKAITFPSIILHNNHY